MEKKIFKIDVGCIPEEDIDEYIKTVMKKFKEMPEGELLDIKFPDSDETSAVVYLAKKQEDLIERLVESIKTYEDEGMVQSMLRSVLMNRKRLKLMEDAQIIYNVTEANKKK